MRLLLLTCCLALACVPQGELQPPPTGNFYFPTGIVYADDPCTGGGKCSHQGVLYVANSNFDRRYSSGSVMAVPLDDVSTPDGGLPTIGTASFGSIPLSIQNLGPDVQQVHIQAFAGEMTKYAFSSGDLRLFVPSRGDPNPLQVIVASGSRLQCLGGTDDCTKGSPALSSLENISDGKPRAVEPLGVGVGTSVGPMEGQVVVTSLKPADSPAGSGNNLEAFIVILDAQLPVLVPSSFVSLGFVAAGDGAPTNSVAVGSRWAYTTTRYKGAGGGLFFLIDGAVRGLFLNFGLEVTFRTLEARGIALSPDESRLYVAGRTPDSLLVISILDPNSDLPTFRVIGNVPLPLGPSEVAVIPRTAFGRGNLVVVSSTTAGMVSIYDEDLGIVTSQIAGVGVQPYGLTVQTVGQAARVFVTCFGDSRIGVIDIPDVRTPGRAQLVAFLGRPQSCVVQETDSSCLGASQ